MGAVHASSTTDQRGGAIGSSYTCHARATQKTPSPNIDTHIPGPEKPEVPDLQGTQDAQARGPRALWGAPVSVISSRSRVVIQRLLKAFQSDRCMCDE